MILFFRKIRQLSPLNYNQEFLLIFEKIQLDFVNHQLRPLLNKMTDRTALRTSGGGRDINIKSIPTHFKKGYPTLLLKREFANTLTDLIFLTERVTQTYKRLDKDMRELNAIITIEYPTIEINP
jgi:hypothetical protein